MAQKPNYSTKSPVLVTGATGYVAGWLVKQLVEEGVTVHAAVRDPSNAPKIAHLKKLDADNPGTIKFFKADLLEEDSFDEAMAGCEVVFHTASPFTSKITDPQRDLVDPAVKGTRNVLQSANKAKSVTRVVVTSSCASIYGDTRDVALAPGGVLTEEIWNTTSRLDHQAYCYSKVEAEKAAWEMAAGQDRWVLVTINPALVVGPGVATEQTSESFSLIKQMGDGTLKAGAPPIVVGVVDVRDVAKAHVRAGFMADAQGRYIVCEKTVNYLELASALKASFNDAYPFPTGEMPKWLIWLVGPFIDRTIKREMIAKNMGYSWTVDNSKSRRELGIEYASSDAAVVEMFQQLIDNGAFAKS